jgi:hypothetical protein
VELNDRGSQLSESSSDRHERDTAQAWRTFQAHLADHLADMADDDVLVLEAQGVVGEDGEGCPRYLQFRAYGDGLLRSEVSSNAYLRAAHRLAGSDEEVLIDLGWTAPTCDADREDPGEGSANFYLDTERADADRLAVMAVTALRTVFGVIHPAFLSGVGVDGDHALASSIGVVGDAEPRVGSADEPIAAYPHDRQELQALVDASLTPVFGHAPEHDQDGDIPVVTDNGLVFVEVSESAPVVKLFASVATDVEDLDRAAAEVQILNRDLLQMKFVLVDDSVMAYLFLPACPFAPEQMRQMPKVMVEVTDKVSADLAERLRTVPGAVELHPAMRTLVELQAERIDSVDPELAASICEYDRELILRLIAETSKEEIAWRAARDQALAEGDTSEAAACDGEMAAGARTVSLLRRALLLVVERALNRSGGSTAWPTTRPRPGKAPHRERGE